MKPLVKFLCLLGLGAQVGGGCRFDKEELAYPPTACDTVDVSYSQDVQPILNQNCYSCHAEAVASISGAGIVLDSYEDLAAFLNNFETLFVEAITHQGTASPMPKNGGKLPACSIQLILAWIHQGMLNN
ncbi:MAG: hypothetical protein N2110_09210 [Flavobacteriales bacterium]|nr:hypothetical protein [Flavobacteriales bacterium]MCX7769180.1 hypothetical protein [Flavobacteriales bacterium]MDW8411023.1 hypothetical protein [Flavobacteriales bacterium]